MPLNRKQSAFVTEYLRDHNAKQAAIRAGYSPHTAEQQGSRQLGKVKVQELIAELETRNRSAAIMEQAEAQAILTRIARAAIPDFMADDGELSIDLIRKARQELQEYQDDLTLGKDDNDPGHRRKRIKLRDPIAAIERLAKLRGWDAPDKHEHGGTLVIDTSGA